MVPCYNAQRFKKKNNACANFLYSVQFLFSSSTLLASRNGFKECQWHHLLQHIIQQNTKQSGTILCGIQDTCRGVLSYVVYKIPAEGYYILCSIQDTCCSSACILHIGYLILTCSSSRMLINEYGSFWFSCNNNLFFKAVNIANN